MNISNLRELQSRGVTDLNSTLRSVEINPTELCNRKCSFCPRVDPKLYKNQKKHISPDLCREIGQQLQDFNFTGRIGFVGFGEPLLHPNLEECIKQIKVCKSAQWIEINTNGDFLTRDLAIKLADAGCTNITISMYDSDKTEYFKNMLHGINVELVLRHHYDEGKQYNLNLINRIDIVKKNKILNVNRPCYMPFYKLFIDWNGDYLLCEQDWRKSTNKYNVRTTTIKDFWLDKLNFYRKNLVNGDRNLYPCSTCDINGTLHGKSSFDILKNIIYD